MRIQIDTDSKVIKLDSKENLGKFFYIIEKMVEDWRDYSIDTNTTIVWQSPIYVQYPYYTQPYWTTSSTTGSESTYALSPTADTVSKVSTLTSKDQMSTLLDGHDKTEDLRSKWANADDAKRCGDLYIDRNKKGTYNLEVN